MYDFVKSQKDYVLLKNQIGTYKITHNGSAVAHPTTEEQAFEKLSQLSSTFDRDCMTWCRMKDCTNCQAYYD